MNDLGVQLPKTRLSLDTDKSSSPNTLTFLHKLLLPLLVAHLVFSVVPLEDLASELRDPSRKNV
jgi:hypothetical protein